MANQFLYADWVVNEALRILTNKLVIASSFNTDFGKEYEKPFPVGETVRIPLPQRYLVRDGQGYSPQPLNRKYTTVACNQIFGIDFEYDSVEQALKMSRPDSEISKQYVLPAMSQIAQEIDSRAALFAYQNCPNIAGVMASQLTDTTISGTARAILMENACPEGEKMLAISPAAMTGVVNGSTTIFNPTSEISRQYKEGSVGKARGFDWYESMSIYSATAGTWAAAVTVNGANQSGSAITISATAGDTFNQGDVIQFANVNNVNPKTRRSTGRTKTFTVTQPLTAVGGGADVLNIYPPIIGPGDQYQNADSLPATGAALTLYPGTASPNGKVGIQGLALHRDAYALVGVKLEVPEAVEVASQSRDPETGIAVRFVKQWDNYRNMMTNRIDVLMGFGVLYPEYCSVRVLCQ